MGPPPSLGKKNPPRNGNNFTPTKKGPKKVKSQDSWAQFPISHLGGHRSCYKILKWLLRVCIFRILGTTDSISSSLEDPSPVAMPLFVCRVEEKHMAKQTSQSCKILTIFVFVSTYPIPAGQLDNLVLRLAGSCNFLGPESPR